jgi:predicted ester cyclase
MVEDIKENIRIVKETLKAFNAYDMDGFTENMSDSILDYIPGRPAPLKGPKAIRDDNSGFLTIFPDAQFKITNVFGQGDWVCAEGFFEGTHEGPFPVGC